MLMTMSSGGQTRPRTVQDGQFLSVVLSTNFGHLFCGAGKPFIKIKKWLTHLSVLLEDALARVLGRPLDLNSRRDLVLQLLLHLAQTRLRLDAQVRLQLVLPLRLRNHNRKHVTRQPLTGSGTPRWCEQ